MVEISCVKAKGDYKEFIFEGHAGFDEKGRDIVCSAVSVLFINTFNAIETFTEDKMDVDKKKDYIHISFSDNISEKGKLLLDAMMLGLSEIEKEYSDNISLTIKEV